MSDSGGSSVSVRHPRTGSASRRDWIDTARRAEDLGYSTLLISDHFDGQFAPIPALMAAAEDQAKFRLGSLVANNDFRHPLVLAKEAATQYLLSEGRLELGLGAGFRKSEYAATGIRCDEPVVRVERLTEAVLLIKRALRSEPLNFSGLHYTVTDYTGMPSPVQPSVPIMIGGGGPRLLRLAGGKPTSSGLRPTWGHPSPIWARNMLLIGSSKSSSGFGRGRAVASRISSFRQWSR